MGADFDALWGNTIGRLPEWAQDVASRLTERIERGGHTGQTLREWIQARRSAASFAEGVVAGAVEEADALRRLVELGEVALREMEEGQ